MLILGKQTIIDDIIIHNSYARVKIKGKKNHEDASYRNISWCSEDWFLLDDETILNGKVIKVEKNP